MKIFKLIYLLLIFILVLPIYAQVEHFPSGLIKNLENPIHSQRILKTEDYDSTTVIDSVFVRKYYVSDEEEYFESFVYDYNSNGNMIYELKKNNREGYWTNIQRTTVEYNSDKKTTLELIEKWDDNSWINYKQTRYLYDREGILAYKINETWDNFVGWIQVRKYTYTYDINANTTYILKENRNGSYWENLSYTIYVYDVNDNLILKLTKAANGNDLENSLRETYNYNSEKLRTLYLQESWNGVSWQNNYKITYEYNANGKVNLRLTEQYYGSEWINDNKYTSTYDSDGFIIQDLRESWEDSVWINGGRFLYKNDSDGNVINASVEFWRNNAWLTSIGLISIYDSFGRRHYYHSSEIDVFYDTITDIAEDNNIITRFSLLQNYPNPFNPSTTIKYSIPDVVNGHARSSTNVTLKIYNVLGQEVSTLVNKQHQPGNYEVVFDASSLPSGTYFYKLTAGDFSETKKLLLLK